MIRPTVSHADDLLTPSQVAAMFNVTRRTVTSWVRNDKIPYFKTPGGQARFRRSDIEAMCGQFEDEPTEATA